MTLSQPIDPSPLYRDSSQEVSTRVADLMGRMTTAEKAAQLGSAWVFELVAGADLVDTAAGRLGDGLGQITRVAGASNVVPGVAARASNAIQRALIEHSRLGIPVVVHEEVCAGLMARDATVFPQPIGLASTWDPALIESMATVVRNEMRAIGAHQGLSPVLDVCRDPRWGRLEETFGEDQHLVACMGIAFVRGLQGTSLIDGVVATAKHFVGYGASEGGLNWAPAHIPAREMKEVYLHPFEAAVKVAGLRSVMNGYQELDGLPCGANYELLTGILRDEWGFDGYVVADYFSVRQLEDYHQLAEDATAAASLGLGSGIDVELPSTDCYGTPLVDAVDGGVIAVEVLDRAVERVLKVKFELGLFENPYVDADEAPKRVGSSEARELAASLAQQSMVLLRNEECLPLDPATAKSIAVIGPNADNARNLLGDYSYAAHVETLLEMRESENIFEVPVPDDLALEAVLAHGETVFEAMNRRFAGASVRAAAGCEVVDPCRDGFDEAVQLAAASDVAVVVVGDKSGLTDDSSCGESRDRSSLDLPGVQEELVQAVLDTGTPVVLVIIAGRPCGSARILEQCAAVLMAWLPGEAGGSAIADIISGDFNPGGKLPVSFPRSVGQIPVYYRHKVSGGRSHWKGDYADGPTAPLYPFGHGLSYTKFKLTSTDPSPSTVGPEGAVTVSVTVANSGQRDGDEVIQVYTRDPRASLTRPVLELKAFAKVSVPAGQSRLATFTIPVAQLGFCGRNLEYVVEPGEIEVHVGTSVNALEQLGSFMIISETGPQVVDQVFNSEVHITSP